MSKEVNESRRNFLRAAGLGSLGVGAAALTQMALQVEPAENAKEPQGKGYRLTSHIRKYYDTARF